VKIELTPTVVRIDMTDADVARIRLSPTAPIGRASIVQWGENVVRSIGLTPRSQEFMAPVVDMKRGVSNRGFKVTVWVEGERQPQPPTCVLRTYEFTEDDPSVGHEAPTEGGY
jgi:hypothetical protein